MNHAPSPDIAFTPDSRTVTEKTLKTGEHPERLDYARGFQEFSHPSPDRSFQSNIDMLEVIQSHGLNTDPRVTFLLVNAYLTSNQHRRGIRFFEKLLDTYQNTMADDVHAIHLSAYAVVRATFAGKVFLPRRISWVRRTFRLLDRAFELTHAQEPIVHWAAGLIYAQVPFFFFKKRAAYDSLNWLADRPETEPVFGFYREVYHFLSKLHEKDGRRQLAQKYLEKSGYSTYQPKALFMGWFTSSKDVGTTMTPAPVLREIIPGRVFVIFGFGFSDVYFVLSDDQAELIAIDAGTQPYSLKAAFRFLQQKHPGLPQVTTAIITHSHWDHIGGHSFLRELNPGIKIYGRDNYSKVVGRVLRNHSYTHFRGRDFNPEWVSSYRPDIAISQYTEVDIGATKFELIPVTGGETEDAMLINLPGLKVMFIGDIIMPWYGEPWVNEGFIDGAVGAMDEVIKRNPEHVLHGHQPLTLLFGYEALKKFRGIYLWLVEAVRDYVRNGYSAKNIIRLNLIPPDLQNHQDLYLPYLASRDGIIARVVDHMVGIWREEVSGQEPEGLDNITAVEYGRMLQSYLGLSVRQASHVLRKMIDNGDNELALKFAVAAEKRYGADRSIIRLKEEAGDQLRSAAQFLDPFKFSTYTEMIGKEHNPVLPVQIKP